MLDATAEALPPSGTPNTFFAQHHPKLILVAATGGHLTQLVRLAEREGVHKDSLWVTFRNAQSESLLAGKRVLNVEYVAPRDLRHTVAAYRQLTRNVDPQEFDGVLSTGPAVGFAGLTWAARNRLPGVYVESVSRTDGPSLTGKMVSRFRVARTYTQHEAWQSERWPHTESILQQYRMSARDTTTRADQPLTIFVTLGTIRPYRFDRLVEKIVSLLKPGDEVTWQLGVTTGDTLPGTVHESMLNHELLDAAMNADVVITHSGVGSLIQLFDRGIAPVIVPRRKEHKEHVDDHQLQIWTHLQRSEIGVCADIPELSRQVLATAASHAVSRPVAHS